MGGWSGGSWGGEKGVGGVGVQGRPGYYLPRRTEWLDPLSEHKGVVTAKVEDAPPPHHHHLPQTPSSAPSPATPSESCCPALMSLPLTCFK